MQSESHLFLSEIVLSRKLPFSSVESAMSCLSCTFMLFKMSIIPFSKHGSHWKCFRTSWPRVDGARVMLLSIFRMVSKALFFVPKERSSVASSWISSIIPTTSWVAS